MLQGFPNDSGPIYSETIAGRFPVEPFNTFSNLIFLFIVLYWGFRVFHRPSHQLFLVGVIPVLGVGWLGGTIYHATRSHEVWLLMDWVPIIVLSFASVGYFIFKLIKKMKNRILLFLLIMVTSLGVHSLPVPKNIQNTIEYVIIAVTVLMPLIWYLYKTNGRNWKLVLLAILSFSIAIGFRFLDKRQDFTVIGTHWLWHLFGGISVFFLIWYIYEDRKVKVFD